MTIRLLREDEWPLLQPIFEREGAQMPASERLAAAAMGADGVAGFWGAYRVWHAGPLWIREDRRGTGLWSALHAQLDKAIGTGAPYFSLSGEPKVETIMTRLGYTATPYKFWKRGV